MNTLSNLTEYQVYQIFFIVMRGWKHDGADQSGWFHKDKIKKHYTLNEAFEYESVFNMEQTL